MDARAAWRWSLRVAAAMTIVPLFLSRHLPFCDLPEHLAVIATLRHWYDPAFKGPEYFTLAPLLHTPYVLYHLVAALLALAFGGAERANLFLLACVGLAFPYSLRELLRALGRDERLAVVGCALFWNKALAEGLVNYVASIPICVFGLAVAVRWAESPTRRCAALLAAIAIALFYLHPSSFVLFVAGAAALAAMTSGARRLAAGAVWLAPSIVAAIVFALTSSVTHPDKSQGFHAGLVRFMPRLRLLSELPSWMHEVWKSPAQELFAIVLWIALAVCVFREGDPRGRARGAVLFAIAVAFYFLMPSQVGFAFLLDVRMAPYVGLFATLLPPKFEGPTPARALAVMTAACALVAVNCARMMRDFEREEAAHFDAVLRGLSPGKRLLTLTFDQRSERAAVAPFIHFGAYYRVRYGGIASFSFSELPHWPVQYRPEAAPPKKRIVFWDWNPCLFRNAKDGAYYDFILARGEIDPFAKTPPGPRWRIIGGAKDWKLWERVPGSWTEGDADADPGPCKQGD